MKLVLLASALGALAGCTQTNPTPPEARWSGPHHEGSGSGRGYAVWLEGRLAAVDYEAAARDRDTLK